MKGVHVSKMNAKEMMKHGEVRGKELSKKQKGLLYTYRNSKGKEKSFRSENQVEARKKAVKFFKTEVVHQLI